MAWAMLGWGCTALGELMPNPVSCLTSSVPKALCLSPKAVRSHLVLGGAGSFPSVSAPSWPLSPLRRLPLVSDKASVFKVFGERGHPWGIALGPDSCLRWGPPWQILG